MALTLETVDVPAVPATTRKKRVITCDSCGLRNHSADYGDNSWNEGHYTRTEVQVHVKQFETYPECGSSEGLFWDFCPECFEAKVVPLLETIAKPRREEEN